MRRVTPVAGETPPDPEPSQPRITSIKVDVGVGTNAGTVAGLSVGQIQANQLTINIAGDSSSWQIASSAVQLSDIAIDNVLQLLQDIERAQRMLATIPDPPVGPQLLLGLLKSYFRSQQAPRDAEPPPRSPENLKCFDQEEIRQLIRYRDQFVRTVEVCGPGGLGKSHVLRAIRDAERAASGIPAEERVAWQQWLRLYVDAQHQRLSLEDLVRMFAALLAGGTATSEAELAPLLVSRLRVSPVSGVLFIIDNADAIPTEVLAHFASDQGLVGIQMRQRLALTSVSVLRLVIAGRSPRLTEQIRKSNGIHGVSQGFLDALSVEHVRAMLEERVDQHGLRAQDELWFDKRAHKIFEVSGGHPRSVAYILNNLAAHGFTTLPDEYRERFTPMVLRIVRQDIIGNLALADYVVLNILSVFRWFTPHELMEVDRQGLLPAGGVTAAQAPGRREALRSWMKDFCESPALIRKLSDKYQFLYVVHPVLRHVLPMDLEQNQPERLQELHAFAQSLYDRALSQRDRSGIRLVMPPILRPTYLLESLYHLARERLLQRQPAADDLAALADRYLAVHRDYESDPAAEEYADPQLYAERWGEDSDLHMHIRSLADGSLAFERLDELFSSLGGAEA